LKLYCANSDLLVLSIYSEKQAPDNSPDSTLELLSDCAQIDQKRLPCLHITHKKNKNIIVEHPTNHGNAHLGPRQQLTNN
jgi:hypothetical protein